MRYIPHERAGQIHLMQTSGNWLSALRRYLAVIAVGNLIWEFAHLPLYTLWNTGSQREIIFAAIHCTGGDILIALTTLAVALLTFGSGGWPGERFRTVALVTLLLGVGYTIFSEWLNIVVRQAWAYSDLMPVIPLAGFQVGLTPVLQWIIVPLAAFTWAQWPRVGR